MQAIRGSAYRLVESQEQVATTGYVDSLEEQAILEDMLEASKPPYLAGTEKLHYLLKTPFRYPPLLWGSRFGQRSEPSIFYAAQSKATSLAEGAYYRFVFYKSMDAKSRPQSTLKSKHTLFKLGYASSRGIKLQDPPFDVHEASLTSVTNYEPCQILGREMRASGIEAFEYRSARDKDGICVGLFRPEALSGTQPKAQERVFCEVSASQVTFRLEKENKILKFPIEQFSVNGTFTGPAS